LSAASFWTSLLLYMTRRLSSHAQPQRGKLRALPWKVLLRLLARLQTVHGWPMTGWKSILPAAVE
jgi:hypothetical protein